MKKTLFIGLASAVALVPALIGLTANPSLSASVPVPSIQVPLSTSTHDANDDKGGRRRATPTSPTSTATHERHGADDGARHDAGDDKGGQRQASSSDDGASHDAGDDRGGKSGKSGSGKHGGDDKGGDDHGGHHGSDD